MFELLHVYNTRLAKDLFVEGKRDANCGIYDVDIGRSTKWRWPRRARKIAETPEMESNNSPTCLQLPQKLVESPPCMGGIQKYI